MDFVQSLGVDSIGDYYDSVLEEEVPAGTVVVLASANVGLGPPPEVPDLTGDCAAGWRSKSPHRAAWTSR